MLTSHRHRILDLRKVALDFFTFRQKRDGDPKYAILSYVTENGWIWNGFTITDTGPIVIVSNVHTVNLVNETTTR